MAAIRLILMTLTLGLASVTLAEAPKSIIVLPDNLESVRELVDKHFVFLPTPVEFRSKPPATTATPKSVEYVVDLKLTNKSITRLRSSVDRVLVDSKIVLEENVARNVLTTDLQYQVTERHAGRSVEVICKGKTDARIDQLRLIKGSTTEYEMINGDPNSMFRQAMEQCVPAAAIDANAAVSFAIFNTPKGASGKPALKTRVFRTTTIRPTPAGVEIDVPVRNPWDRKIYLIIYYHHPNTEMSRSIFGAFNTKRIELDAFEEKTITYSVGEGRKALFREDGKTAYLLVDSADIAGKIGRVINVSASLRQPPSK